MSDQPGPSRPLNMLHSPGSMRTLLDQGGTGVYLTAKAAKHGEMLPSLMKETVEAKAAPKPMARIQGWAVGAEVVHAPSRQRVVITKTNVGKTATGEPVHVVKPPGGKEAKVPQRNLQLMD